MMHVTVDDRPLATVVSMSAWTIVLAAGAGQRFGGTKQFERLGDRRLVDWAVDAARAASDGVIVVVPHGHRWDGAAVDAAVAGGATHGASVLAGLTAVPPTVAVAVVGTAAHPLASPALHRAVIEAVETGADAATPAVASADALKRVADDRVIASIDKTDLRIVQAPSAFRADLLREVLARPDRAPEELELIERAGGRVVTVPGEASNIHVATPDDLALVRRIVGHP